MREEEIRGVDLKAYTKTLANGFKIYLVPNKKSKKKNKYYAALGTHYGALDIDFSLGNKTISSPAGIAHFLEHKIFAQEDGVDPFTFFSESGCYSNAYTNYKVTCFIIGGSKELEKNLDFLIDFVHQPYFTKENVEQEKDIIVQEIRMYQDNPGYQVSETLSKNIYLQLPFYNQVIGSEKSVRSVTVEDLNTCYQAFYQPQNMFLVMTGNFDPITVMEQLTEKISKFENKKEVVKIKKYHEPMKIKKEMEVIHGKVELPKIAIAYKMSRDSFPIVEDYVLDLYLNMITAISFGSTSDFREMIRKRGLTTGIGYYFRRSSNCITLFIEAECKTETAADELIEEIDKYLKHLVIHPEDLERIKKVWISSEIIRSDYAENYLDYLVDDIIEYNRIVLDYVDLIRKMNMKELEKIVSKLNFKQRSIVKLLKQDKEN